MRPSAIVLGCVAMICLTGPSALAGEEASSAHASHSGSMPTEAELTADVPALTAFHEVIFELWHDAWPNQNAALIRELLPKVKQDFASVEKAVLPGILRDKQAAWDEGLKAMAACVADYEKAAAGKDDQALLDTVESLHSLFERQMRVVRPYLRELEDYHVFLYQIYHHFAPGKNLEMLSGAADSLGTRCGPLMAAPPPRWFQGDAAVLKAEIDALCGRTKALGEATGTADWAKIDAAVEAVHAQYVKILSLFE